MSLPLYLLHKRATKENIVVEGEQCSTFRDLAQLPYS